MTPERRGQSGADGGAVDRTVALTLKEASDGALVVAIGRWREDALAEAYRRHGGAVFGLARRLFVASKNPPVLISWVRGA